MIAIVMGIIMIFSWDQPKHVTAGAPRLPSLQDWVVTTDDTPYSAYFGCDQIGIRDRSDLKRGLIAGMFYSSPMQLTGAPNGTCFVATGQRRGEFVHVYCGHPTSSDSWNGLLFSGGIVAGSAPAITTDSQFVLLATDKMLSKYRLTELLATGDSSTDRQSPLASRLYARQSGVKQLPNPVASVPGIIPAAIEVAPDGRSAHVVASDGFVYTIDLEHMVQSAPKVSYRAAAQWPLYSTFASLSPNGRYLAIGVGIRNAIGVVDVERRKFVIIDAPGAGSAYGLQFNYSLHDAEFLAIHGGNRVTVFRFSHEALLSLTPIVSIAVPAKDRGLARQLSQGQEETMPQASLAWTGRGDAIIAAVGPVQNDWVTINFAEGDPATLEIETFFKSCDAPASLRVISQPNDVFTFNLIPTFTPIPSPSATPEPSATPSATPNLTVTPSPSPSPPPTDSPTPSPSPSPSATPTRTPAPAYLPLLLRERCSPEQRRIDVVLVLDASLSMLESAGGDAPPAASRSKLDAARDAARAFLDALRLGGTDDDQAAVVGFNSVATLQSPLTADRTALDRSLAAIAPAAGTCIVCAVDAAAAELTSARHQAGHAPVLVLLTDGRSNPQPAAAAVARAAAAKAAGIRVYTIGLGADLDETALREMASGPDAYRHAPSAAELAAIYRAIAVDIPCPAATFWAGR